MRGDRDDRLIRQARPKKPNPSSIQRRERSCARSRRRAPERRHSGEALGNGRRIGREQKNTTGGNDMIDAAQAEKAAEAATIARSERRLAAMESFALAWRRRGIIEVTDIIQFAVQAQFDAIRCGRSRLDPHRARHHARAEFDERITAEWEKTAAELSEERAPRLEVAKSLNGLKRPQ